VIDPIQFDREAYLRLIRGQPSGLGSRLARGALAAATLIYGPAVAVRNFGFDRGWLRTHRAPLPVVSVGNLTLGGTGKTPMVEWIARWFRNRGARVAILSRGYGHTGGMNDEGRVLEENLPDVPHLQNPDRVALAKIAAVELETELIVLDDGFQHRRLKRDLDVVLLDALEPFGLSHLSPRGLLREPVGSLRRAGVVVISRSDLIAEADRAAIRAEAERHAGSLKWVEARHAPLDLVDSEGHMSALTELSGRSVAAFCGIGNPEGFRRTLQALGTELIDFRVFPDHHPYTALDVSSLERWVALSGANLVLTTQKDSVKLRAASLGAAPLRALRIGLEITAGREIMDDLLARLLPGQSRDEPGEKEFV
jgi:tetraacyldisaccharide 4'-kinase